MYTCIAVAAFARLLVRTHSATRHSARTQSVLHRSLAAAAVSSHVLS